MRVQPGHDRPSRFQALHLCEQNIRAAETKREYVIPVPLHAILYEPLSVGQGDLYE